MKKILIVLGATGGHIFPGLAIAKNFKKMNEEIVVSFVNTKNIKIGFLKIEPSQELFEINSLGFKGKPFLLKICLLYTSPSPRDGLLSRMPSSA